MSALAKPIDILSTAYFEDRVVAIAHRVKKESGIVNVNDVLKAFGFTSKRMHRPIARILDANGFNRRKMTRRAAAEVTQSCFANDFRPFVTIVSPDR